MLVRHLPLRSLSSAPSLVSEGLRRTFTTAVQISRFPTLCTGGSIGRPTKSLYIYCSARHLGNTQRRQITSATPLSEPRASPPTPPTATVPPPPSRLRRTLTTSALILFLFTLGAAMSAAPAADTVNGLMNPPTDAETLILFEPTTPTAEEINAYITTHPLATRLRAQPTIVESRPHLKIPVGMRPHNLTGGALAGPGRLEVPPLVFSDRDIPLPTMTQFLYFGGDLCGHPGIVHGGCLATMLDEGLARACFPALPNKVGVTASLKIDYRVPVPAERYCVLRAETTKVEGRKAWVKGWIEMLGEEDTEGVKMVEAEALFIEPRGAKNMARIYSDTR